MPFPCPALPPRAGLLRVGAAAAPVALIGALLSATPALADTTAVSTSDELNAALDAIQPGAAADISLASMQGVYTLDGEVDLPAGSDVTVELNDQTISGTRILIGAGASLNLVSPSIVGNLTADNSTGAGPAVELSTGSAFHVSGASVTATGGTNGAGIGTGDGSPATGANVLVDRAAFVIATGGQHGAGVGGSRQSVPAAVTVLDGSTLQASGGDGGAGIGGGENSLAGGSLVAGDASNTADQYNVEASAGDGAAAVGGGYGGPAIDLTQYGLGIVKVDGDSAGDSAIGTGAGVAQPSLGSVHVASEEGRLYVATGSEVAIPDGETLLNDGRIWLDGTFTGTGSIQNNGSILPSEAYAGAADSSDPLTIVKRVGAVAVKGHNYSISFDAGAGSVSPSSIHVLANYVDNTGQHLPTPVAPTGSTFTSWLAGDVPVADNNPLEPIAETQGQDPTTSADGTSVAIVYTAGYSPANPDPTPTPTPTETTPAPVPTDTATPTPAPTETVTPTPQPTETSTPTPVETTTPAPAETTTPTPAPTSSPAPAPSVLTAKAAAVNVSGAKLSVAVKGLAVGERYTVTVDGKKATSGTAAKSSVTVKVSLPKAKRDTKHIVRVVGAHSAASVKVTTVTASKHLKVTKSGKRSFTVKGLAAGEHVTVKVSGKVVGSGIANAKGIFAFTAKSLKKGTRTLVAKGATAKRTDSLKTRLS